MANNEDIDISVLANHGMGTMAGHQKTAMEIQAEMDAPSHPVYTYPISDFNAGVISKTAVVRHFQRLNPDLKITGAGAFKIDHEKACVTIELKTVKKVKETPDPDEVKKLQDRIVELERFNAQLKEACEYREGVINRTQAGRAELSDRVEELEKVKTAAQNLIDNKRPIPECKTTGEYFAWSEYWIKLQQALSADGE